MNFQLVLSILIFHEIQNSIIHNQNEPLIITDYLNNGYADLARRLSVVEPFVGNVTSHSGYFRVSDDCVRNMFFWYFPAENGNQSAPLLVWLQGGPGASSMYGLFEELGPYHVDSNLNVHKRNSSWTNEYNVIFIDNPVGTGFSYSEEKCYLSNEDQVGLYLSICMQQFYQLFPDMTSNSLYITGESYAGKYVPAMVYAIDQWNQNNSNPMNLRGMAIGNGWIDPYNMMDYGSYFYYTGLIFDNEIEKFDNYKNLVLESINEKRYLDAFNYDDEMMDGDLYKYGSLFYNLTGLTNFYNYREDGESPSYYKEFLLKNSIKLNVGNRVFDLPDMVEIVMREDSLKTMAPTVQYIINAGYKCLFYSGQIDLIVPSPFTSEFLRMLEWNGKEEFNVADQQIWYSKTSPRRVNGYLRKAGNVQQIIVRNAGHMVPTDQPEAALEMLRNFIYDLNF